MPAKSKSQQRLFGMVHALQKGEAQPSQFSPKIRALAQRVDPQDAHDFAATQTKHLPEKKASLLDRMFAQGFLSRLKESRF